MACAERASKRLSHALSVRFALEASDMADFSVVRPRDDADARQASEWCDDLVNRLVQYGHTEVDDVDDRTPADIAHIVVALSRRVDLVCYFGHGREDAWLTAGYD